MSDSYVTEACFRIPSWAAGWECPYLYVVVVRDNMLSDFSFQDFGLLV